MTMRKAEFEKLVAEGFKRLPEWVRKKVENVALLVEDEPSLEDRESGGLSDDETLLGLYKGIPLSERGEMYGVGATMPDTITLYRRPIEEAAVDKCSTYEVEHEKYKDTVARIVAETIWHEFAHHFGMDEHEVQMRETKRKDRSS